MTTIAYRDGILAADSGATTSTEAGGTRKSRCRKLYRKFITLLHVPTKTVTLQDVVIGVAGEGFAALQFCDWLYSQKPEEADIIRELLVTGSADFSALVLTRTGLFEYDRWCRYEAIVDPYYAIGSGAKAALGAMYMGADPKQAVAAAIDIDPFTFGGIAVAKLLPEDTDYYSDTMKDVVAQGLIEIDPETA